MDLAIGHAEQQGFEELVICDAFTGRLDHSLGNLQLLIQAAARGTCVWGIGEETVIAPLVAPGPFCSLSFAEGAQGTCSVLSHSDVCKGVTEVGLEWELGGATCTNRALWGISNELIGGPPAQPGRRLAVGYLPSFGIPARGVYLYTSTIT